MLTVHSVLMGVPHQQTLKQILKIVVDLNEQAGGEYNNLIDALHLELDLLTRETKDR